MSQAACGRRVEGWQVRADGMDADSGTWWSFTVSGFEPEGVTVGTGPATGDGSVTASEAEKSTAPGPADRRAWAPDAVARAVAPDPADGRAVAPPRGVRAVPVLVPADLVWRSLTAATPAPALEAPRHGTERVAAAAASAASPEDPHPPTPLLVEYYHTDALGSVRVVTKVVNGQLVIVSRHDFMPFGEEVNPPNPPTDTRLFTGQERDAKTGLDHFNAPQLAAGYGRFTTVDPLTSLSRPLANPQRYSAYGYARGNPFRFVDPTGLDGDLLQFEDSTTVRGTAGVMNPIGLTAADLATLISIFGGSGDYAVAGTPSELASDPTDQVAPASQVPVIRAVDPCRTPVFPPGENVNANIAAVRRDGRVDASTTLMMWRSSAWD